MEVYDLAIKISMQDGATKVFSLLATQIPIIGKHFDKLTESALRTKVAIAGIGSVMAGAALFKGFEKFENAGEHLAHAKTLFEAALPIADRVAGMAKVTATAYAEAGRNMQSTLVGNIDAMHDLYTITQSVEHATKLLPAYNALANAYASVKDQSSFGDKATGSNIASAIRAFELTGRNTEEKLTKVADTFVNTTIGLGSKAITGGQLLTQISNAGAARYGWDDEFLTTVLPAMITTGLQNRTGSALYMAHRNLFGGVSSSGMQGEFQEKWGLHKLSDELTDDSGHFKGFRVGSVFEADKMQSNPFEWGNDYRKLLHDKYGVNVDDPARMQKIIGEIGRGNKGLLSFLDEILLPQTNAQLNKEVGNLHKVGPDARDVVGANDPGAARRALGAKWDDAMAALGEPLVRPMINHIIKPLTFELKELSGWAGAHPGLIKEIGSDLLLMSVGLVSVGSVMTAGALMAALGPTGWLVAGFGALAAKVATLKPAGDDKTVAEHWLDAIEGLKTQDWKKVANQFFPEIVQTAFSEIAADMRTKFSLITSVAFDWGKRLEIEVMSWPSRLKSAIDRFSDSLVQMLKDALNRLNPFSKTGYEGGGLGYGNLLHRASYGGANDNYATAGRVGGGAYASLGNSASQQVAGIGGVNNRGVNNMNPGNIGWGSWAAAHGATGWAGRDSGHGVAVFPSFETGLAAMGALALSKYGSGRHSIDALIAGAGGWTPGNHQAAANVARMMGISPYADAHLDDPDMMRRFREGLMVQELGPGGAAAVHRRMKISPPPTAGAPPKAASGQWVENHHHIYIGGTKVAHEMSRQMASAAKFPTATGGMDSYGTWRPPGTTLTDAA